MNPIRSIFLFVTMVAPSLALAETMNFEDATSVLGASCAEDIDTYCRGVNLDAVRLKDCLSRNQDGITAKCKVDYVRAFDAIQQRVKARSAVAKMCERDALKFCKDAQKQDVKILECLLSAPRGMTASCNQAINAAGYR
jgi:hypothetical protein